MFHTDDHAGFSQLFLKPKRIWVGPWSSLVILKFLSVSISLGPSIIADGAEDVVIDGHHRLQLFKAAGFTIVPAVSVHYEHPDILVNPPGLRPEALKGGKV